MCVYAVFLYTMARTLFRFIISNKPIFQFDFILFPNLRTRLGTAASEQIAERFPINAAAEGLVAAWRETLAEMDASP